LLEQRLCKERKLIIYPSREVISETVGDYTMSKKVVNAATEFRDSIPELEGLLIGKLDGTKLWGDTLKDLNHEFILSSASVAIRAADKLSKAIEKNEIISLEINIEGGYATIFALKKAIVVGFYGEDARAQIAIINRNLKTFATEIDKLV
jgi:predicted regulator of Ras-like GTPase activity (Roadblock/LC7/MglB family)